MNWYYVDAGQQAGPVDDAQLEALRNTGRIQSDTLIWREGMTNWQPYSEAKMAPVPMAAALLPPRVTAATPINGGNEAVCVECKGIFNTQEMIRYGNLHVCANCKPIFMQKLAEGARLTGTLNFASGWTRFAAWFIDLLIMKAVTVAFVVVAGVGMAATAGNNQVAGAIVIEGILVFALVAIGLTYETVMVGKYGATLGKMACRIQVVNADGGKVSYMRALGRYFGKLLSYLTFYVGFIMAFFDDEKQALHDRICSTRVVLKQ
jgi:uncharacterized RDD family membrane protein YckC